MTEGSSIVTAASVCPQCGAPVELPDYADMALCSYCGSTLEREHTRVLREEWEKSGERQRLRSVKCSQCAGSLSVFRGKRLLVCDHCGVRTAVLGAGGVSRWYFPARIDRMAAAVAGARWLRTYPGIEKDFRGATLVEAKLVYAPIWEHRVLAAGWEYGYKSRNRIVANPQAVDGDAYQPLEFQMIRKKVKEPRLHERRFYLPATDLGFLGAKRPRVTGRELLVPLLAGELEADAIALEAEGDGSEVEKAGRAMAKQPLTGANTTRMQVYLFRESTSLLYYPLWILRYRRGDSWGKVIVNGRHDNINSAVVPADLRRKNMKLLLRVAGSALGAAVVIAVSLTQKLAENVMIPVAAVLLAAAVVEWLRFKPDKEVKYHDPYAA